MSSPLSSPRSESPSKTQNVNWSKETPKNAILYDIVHDADNFRGEAQRIHKIIKQHYQFIWDGKAKISILLVTRGTGRCISYLSFFNQYLHNKYLKKQYYVECIVKTEEFLKQAQLHNPDVHDITDFDLKKEFDVVICLGGDISHTRSSKMLKKAIFSMRKHLKLGGLLLAQPWLTKETYKEGVPLANFVDRDDIKLARMCHGTMMRHYDTDVDDGSKDIENKGTAPFTTGSGHYLHREMVTMLVPTTDKSSVFTLLNMVATIAGVDNFEEIEQVGLWSNEQYLEAFESCGMEARWDASAFAGLYLADPTDQQNLGLFIAKKSTEKAAVGKQYCKVVCTGDWIAQLNYLTEKGWEMSHLVYETESKYRELDDYGKPLKHGIRWYDIKTQCILLEKTDEVVPYILVQLFFLFSRCIIRSDSILSN